VLSTRCRARRRWEVRGRKSEVRWFKLLNIEQQNKEPQNNEVITSIFYGSKRR
jgi:hypothetical protein